MIFCINTGQLLNQIFYVVSNTGLLWPIHAGIYADVHIIIDNIECRMMNAKKGTEEWFPDSFGILINILFNLEGPQAFPSLSLSS